MFKVTYFIIVILVKLILINKKVSNRFSRRKGRGVRSRCILRLIPKWTRGRVTQKNQMC